ncbi:MAG: hypothetical protein HY711_06880 [Candidatus Melainabacteria bacterium]|nr:hypothetical protein [Candidatus Melainabacteria bacterium]
MTDSCRGETHSFDEDLGLPETQEDLGQHSSEISQSNGQTRQEAPGHLKAFEAVAEGYKYYMSRLKDGVSSGISGFFGKPTFFLSEEGDAEGEAKGEKQA